jgi:hypothetical protein
MAITRYYFDRTAGGVTPSSWSAGWNKTSQNDGTWTLSTSKVGSDAQVEANSTSSATTPEFHACVRFVSAALSAGDIGGVVRGVMECRQSNAGLDGSLALGIKVIKSDGTDRGILLAVTAIPLIKNNPLLDDPAEFPTVLFANAETRRFADASSNHDIALSTVTAQSNDRIVVECGFRDVSGSGVIEGSIAYGSDTGVGDHAHADGTAPAADLNGWIEFDDQAAPSGAPWLTYAQMG